MTYDHPSAADGQYSFYLQNTSTNLVLVISAVVVNATNIARVKLWEITGTAADGVARTPKNENLSSANDADTSTALHDGGGTTISGLSTSGIEIKDASIIANGHVRLELKDTVRLGQNNAIALEMDTGTSTPTIFGEIEFFFE